MLFPLLASIGFVLTLASVGCGDSAQEHVTYPMYARGGEVHEVAFGGWHVTLEDAHLAIGPVYFCATAAAFADLCPAAVQEFASSARVNLLDPTPQSLGDVTGVTGEIRSAIYDLGITWLSTQQNPTPTAAAPGGHALRIEGFAERDTERLAFVAEVDVAPMFQGTHAVNGARAAAVIEQTRVRLDVTVDPAALLAGVDFDALAETSADDGPVFITEGSVAHNAIVIGLTANAPPTFVWSDRNEE